MARSTLWYTPRPDLPPDDELYELGAQVGEDWMVRGRCREVDADLFFPEKGDLADLPRWVCSRCPVQLECAAYALHWDLRHGVWGGLTQRDRVRIRRRREVGTATEAA